MQSRGIAPSNHFLWYPMSATTDALLDTCNGLFHTRQPDEKQMKMILMLLHLRDSFCESTGCQCGFYGKVGPLRLQFIPLVQQ